MKNMENINSCTFGGNTPAFVRQLVNVTSNVCGIMFFVTFLGYIAFHCF